MRVPGFLKGCRNEADAGLMNECLLPSLTARFCDQGLPNPQRFHLISSTVLSHVPIEVKYCTLNKMTVFLIMHQSLTRRGYFSYRS